jgi:hypothetical protein
LAPGAIGLAVSILVDVAGSLQLQQKRLDGTYADIGAATAVSADTLAVATLDYNPGEVRVSFDPTPTAGTITGTVEGHYFGQGGFTP